MVLKWLNSLFDDKDKPTESKSSQGLSARYERWLRDLLQLPGVIQVLTYEAAIKYFVTDRPDNDRIKKGAIMRQQHSEGHLISELFIDRDNELVLRPDGKPYGRQLLARELDEELLDAFGNKDLIIVE